MKKFILPIILLISIIMGCDQSKAKIETDKHLSQAQRPWIADDTLVSKEEKRFYDLTECLQKKFDSGKFQGARDSIDQLKLLLPKYLRNWNYGNATHKMNIIKGRMALREGKIDDAKRFLLDAGKTHGSPQLNSFGPNMSLAKDLLEKGEKNAVLEYFDLCRVFWKNDSNKLDTWSSEVKNDRIPRFGPNLIF